MYISEAHPSDGWNFGGDQPRQARTREERRATADAWHRGLGARAVPLLVDGIDDAVNDAFSARPERLYVVRRGRVAFQGGEGPFDYSLDAMVAALEALPL